MTPQKLAQKVLHENYIFTPPVPVESIARNYGLLIVYGSFPDDYARISGFLVPEDEDMARVYVSDEDSALAQRFTIAHQLGRWLLQREAILDDPNKSILQRLPLSVIDLDKDAKAANEFAAELLVSRTLLRGEDAKKTPQALAELCEVSQEVVGYAAKAHKQASRRKMVADEPNEDRQPVTQAAKTVDERKAEAEAQREENFNRLQVLWSWALLGILAIGVMVPAAIALLAGRGWLHFESHYETFLALLAGHYIAQIIGICIIAVRYLFPNKR